MHICQINKTVGHILLTVVTSTCNRYMMLYTVLYVYMSICSWNEIYVQETPEMNWAICTSDVHLGCMYPSPTKLGLSLLEYPAAKVVEPCLAI